MMGVQFGLEVFAATLSVDIDIGAVMFFLVAKDCGKCWPSFGLSNQRCIRIRVSS